MAKTIDLRDTANHVINLPGAKERLEQTESVLKTFNIPYKRFGGYQHERGIVGCGISHFILLEKSYPNTLILEDDICWDEDMHTPTSILEDIPDNADAIYLGVSNHGYVPGFAQGIANTSFIIPHNDKYHRVVNMCGTHAIFYLTDRYLLASVQAIQTALKENIPFDLLLASIHQNHHIYTPTKPWFYQKDQPQYTKPNV